MIPMALATPMALKTSSSAFAALIWWVVPVVVVLGAIGYVIWVSKFQDKFDNETNRSVAKFSEFQKSFNQPVVQSAESESGESKPATGSTEFSI
jgi:hypothetical protein